jgi:hypothetical protein
MEVNLAETIYNHIINGLTNNGNRSSKRTNKIHTDILNYIRNAIQDFDIKYDVFYEDVIKCAYGNNFKVDIVIKDKTGNILVCILIKAFISSVQKNRANNANTTQGEIFRIKEVSGREDVKVWFISLISNNTPNYRIDGTLRNMENIETSYVDLSCMESRSNIYHSTIKYDLLNIDYTTKENFKNTLFIDNIKNISEDTLINYAKRIL